MIPDRAISVRAPWWTAILHLGKDIEKVVLARGLRAVVEDRVLLAGNKTVIFR